MDICIKPQVGMKVHDPYRDDFLPAEGRRVAKSSYWIRRLNEGSVILNEESAPKQNSGGDKK